MKNSEEKNKKSLAWVGIPLSIVVFLLIHLMPRPEGLTAVSQAALAMFSAALILWVAKPIPIYQTSILAILLLPMLGIVKKQSVAFGTLGFDIIWLMVAAFVLTSAMSTSNLGKRIALILVTRFGKTPTKMLAILVVVNFVLAFFVPSTTARASLIMPIALVLLEVYRAIPGESKFGKLMMLQGVQNNADGNCSTSACLRFHQSTDERLHRLYGLAARLISPSSSHGRHCFHHRTQDV